MNNGTGNWKQQQKPTSIPAEDLAIAYTPGVAEPCKVIAKDPEAATNIQSNPTL